MSVALIGGLAVDVAGDGDAVISVRGLGGSSNTFQSFIGALQGKRAIRLDLLARDARQRRQRVVDAGLRGSDPTRRHRPQKSSALISLATP